MGYYASGYGMITIRTDYDTPTLQKLYNSKTLDFRDGLKELQAETFLDLILDHDEAFEAVSYSEEHETTMDLTFCASENYHGKLVEETLAFLAPVTVKGDIFTTRMEHSSYMMAARSMTAIIPVVPALTVYSQTESAVGQRW